MLAQATTLTRDQMSKLEAKMGATVKKANNVVHQLGSNLKEVISEQETRLAALEEKAAQTTQPSQRGGFSKINYRSNSDDAREKEVKRLEAHISQLERARAPRPPSPNFLNKRRTGEEDSLRTSESQSGEIDWVGRFGLQDRKIQELTSLVTGRQVFKSDDVIFRDFNGVLKFVEENNLETVSLFPDGFTAWYLTSPKPGPGQDHANQIVSPA